VNTDTKGKKAKTDDIADESDKIGSKEDCKEEQEKGKVSFSIFFFGLQLIFFII